MFEKEAEERTEQYMNKHTERYNCENTKLETDNYNTGLEYGYEEGFQNGAEFGYNKANEWHYVKDGDLPKGLPKPVLVAFHNKFSDKFVIDIARYSLELDKWWFIHDLKDMEEDVIAWKEIVLPKESE